MNQKYWKKWEDAKHLHAKIEQNTVGKMQIFQKHFSVIIGHNKILLSGMKKDSNEYIKFLKTNAVDHIEAKRYAWAKVYLCDGIQHIDDMLGCNTFSTQQEKIILEEKVPLHKSLSLCYLRQGHYESCINECLEVLKYEPECYKMLYRVGIAHLHLRHFEQAIRFLERGLAISPQEKQMNRLLEIANSNKQTFNKQDQSPSTFLSCTKTVFLWPFILLKVILIRLFFCSKRTV